MKKRNEVIDIARGIGLFFVILGHLIQINSNFFRCIFSFHMPLFFFLAGMCYNYKKHDSFCAFFKDKVKKRIIPYLYFLLFGIILCLIIPSWRVELFSTNPLNILLQIVYYTQPEDIHIGQIWFLIALFFAEIILYAINKIFDKFERNKFLMIGIYLLLILLGNKILILTNFWGLIRLPFKIDTAIISAVFMGLGYEANKNKIYEKMKNTKYNNLCILIFLLLGFLIGQYNGYVNICDCIYNNIILYFLSALFGISGVILVSEKISKNSFLEFYGKNSLFIFAIHSFLISIFTYIISIIYGMQMIALKNIPIELCFIGSIIIYIILFPITILYNKIIQRIEIKSR